MHVIVKYNVSKGGKKDEEKKQICIFERKLNVPVTEKNLIV